MKFVWDEQAWHEYVGWQRDDKRVLKRINDMVKDISRKGNEGIGKPESLKHGFSGYWSGRITDEHRLVNRTAGLPATKCALPSAAITTNELHGRCDSPCGSEPFLGRSCL